MGRVPSHHHHDRPLTCANAGRGPSRFPGVSDSGRPSTRRKRFSDQGSGEPRRLAVRRHGTEQRSWTSRGQGSTMTDPQPAPLQPPAGTAAALTLTAPPPPQPVATTAAPRMAPAVEAAALPGLDAKVDGYLESLLARGSPLAGVRGEGHRRAHHGRRRHPQGGRDLQPAAEVARQGPAGRRPRGGVQGGRRPCWSCAGPSRTSTPRRPPAPRSSSA